MPRTELPAISRLTLVLAIAAGCSGPQPSAPLKSAASAALENWFVQSCRVGEPPLADDLRKYGAELAGPLIEAFEKGPSKQDVERQRASAQRRWRKLHQTLEQGDRLGLSQEAANRLLAADAADIARERADLFVASYRLAALSGLAATRTAEGRRYLEKVANGQEREFQEAARRLLGLRDGDNPHR